MDDAPARPVRAAARAAAAERRRALRRHRARVPDLRARGLSQRVLPPGTGELDFSTPEQLHDSLLGVAASGEGCTELGLPRVQPGDPAHSLLLLKLRPGPPCGKIMPPAAISALSPEEIAEVERWIAGCRP